MIILLILAGVLIVPFWIRNKTLYKEGFGDALNARLNLMLIEMHTKLNDVPGNPIFSVSQNFINYTANLILKFVIFAVVTIILHFTNSLFLTSLYILPLIFAWQAYKKRKDFYNAMSDEYKKAYSSLYKACICIPLYQTLLFVFVEIMFIFAL